MRALLLATMIVLSFVMPARAQEETERVKFIGVEMSDILVSSPSVPGSRAVVVTAWNRWVNGQLADTTAVLLWLNGPGGDILSRQTFTLQARDVVVNGGLTRGVLHLPDGSVLSWIAGKDWNSNESDVTDHVGGANIRSVRRELNNYATATGTLAGSSFDTARDNGGTFRGVAIFRTIFVDRVR